MSNSTLTRAESSRINGAKSRGPKTEAGRQRSSMNALRHGFLANSVVLEGEDRDCFNQVLEYHIEKFQPKDDVEQDLIDEMVAAGWRMRRLWWIETELFNKATKAATDPTISTRVATAFTRLAQTNQLELLDRYESRLHKMYQRAFKTLLEIRKSEEFSPAPNEPEPTGSLETASPAEPLWETETPQPPNEPEQPRKSAPPAAIAPLPNEPEPGDDYYPTFTFDASGKIIGKTYVQISKIPDHPQSPDALLTDRELSGKKEQS
jgi:hypothetical protein